MEQALVMLPDEDLKKPLRVQLVGEDAVDEGGVRKEYFQVRPSSPPPREAGAWLCRRCISGRSWLP